MRLALTIALIFSITTAAEEKKELLDVSNMAKGDIGRIGAYKGHGNVAFCKSIINDSSMLAVFHSAVPSDILNRNPAPISTYFIIKTDTTAYVDGKEIPDKIANGKFEVIGREKVGLRTYFVIAPVIEQVKPLDKTGLVLPEEIKANPVGNKSPDEIRVGLLKDLEQAKKFKLEFEKKSELKGISEDQKTLWLNAVEQWKKRSISLKSSLSEAKQTAEKSAKVKITAEAASKFPVPKGSTLTARAKIETKQNAWIQEQLKIANAQIAKDYAYD